VGSFQKLYGFPTRVAFEMFDKAGYLTLPSDQLSEEAKSYLKQRIAAVGGKL